MNNEHMENEERQIMTFLDEEGHKAVVETVVHTAKDNTLKSVIVSIPEDGAVFTTEEEKEYLLLAPADDIESEDVFVFRVDEVDGKEELNLVEDDREFLAVKKEYKKLLY